MGGNRSIYVPLGRSYLSFNVDSYEKIKRRLSSNLQAPMKNWSKAQKRCKPKSNYSPRRPMKNIRFLRKEPNDSPKNDDKCIDYLQIHSKVNLIKINTFCYESSSEDDRDYSLKFHSLLLGRHSFIIPSPSAYDFRTHIFAKTTHQMWAYSEFYRFLLIFFLCARVTHVDSYWFQHRHQFKYSLFLGNRKKDYSI